MVLKGKNWKNIVRLALSRDPPMTELENMADNISISIMNTLPRPYGSARFTELQEKEIKRLLLSFAKLIVEETKREIWKEISHD